MAKAESEQLDLIDVDGPEFKAVKREITAYETLKASNGEAVRECHENERAKRRKVLEAVISAGVKPDADGAYHVRLDGKVYDLSQESQLRIKKHKAPKEEVAEPKEVEGTDEVAETLRKRK